MKVLASACKMKLKSISEAKDGNYDPGFYTLGRSLQEPCSLGEGYFHWVNSVQMLGPYRPN